MKSMTQVILILSNCLKKRLLKKKTLISISISLEWINIFYEKFLKIFNQLCKIKILNVHWYVQNRLPRHTAHTACIGLYWKIPRRKNYFVT